MEGEIKTNVEETESRYFEFQEQAKLELDNIQNEIERLMKNIESLVPEDDCDSDECLVEEATSTTVKCLQDNTCSETNRDDFNKKNNDEIPPVLNWDNLVQSIIGDLNTFNNLNEKTEDVVRRINHIEEAVGECEYSEEESE